MSRVTPPVNKFAQSIRSISSSAQAARPSALLDSNSRYLPRSIRDLKTECSTRKLKTSGNKAELVDRLVAHDLIRDHSTTAGHRPTPPHNPPVTRFRPLMQGFRTSAPAQTAHDTSTIDYFKFPEVPGEPDDNPFLKMRVPLLPDNYYPDRSAESAHAVEATDEAVPRPEIVIVASHPGEVSAAAMTEIVGNDGEEHPLEQLTEAFKSVVGEDVKEVGMLKELWNSLWEDLMGPRHPKVAM